MSATRAVKAYGGTNGATLSMSGTGLSSASVSLVRQAGEGGVTEIWAEVAPAPFILIFR